jgi:hypothetical protein
VAEVHHRPSSDASSGGPIEALFGGQLEVLRFKALALAAHRSRAIFAAHVL